MLAASGFIGDPFMAQANVNHTTLEYRLDGPDGAPVIVLSNSLASNLTMWNPQLPALLNAGFRVLRYDSRGHGGSSVQTGPYTMEMLTGDLAALLDHLRFDQVCVMGCSMGGMVAQMFASTQPERVRALLLTATACHMPPPDLWDQRIAAVRAGGMPAVAEGTIERWFTGPGRARMPAEVKRVREMVAATPAEGFCACCEAIRDMDQRESIKSIRAPTLVIVGEQDPGTPVAAAQAIHERIAGSRLTIIPEAAHFVHMEQEAAFNAAMTGLLNSL